MKIAIASGKGGTGKTTIATNLAYYLTKKGNKVVYADCDVEEPNGHLFLTPNWEEIFQVNVKNPVVDDAKCDYCMECAKICQFNALAVLIDKVLLFPSLCHGCGGCYHICPQKAITEVDRSIGVIKAGTGKGITAYEGRLNIGEAISPPVIKRLKELLKPADYTIIDSPPGTSCPVIEAVSNCDYVILVTEPTPFGLNDLELAVNMVQTLNLPFGVIVNRHGVGDERIHTYCKARGINILLEIPNSLEIAKTCSKGNLLIDNFPQYSDYFESLMQNIPHPLKATGT